MQGMANTELQVEMARRDQVIYNQREAQRNLWNLLMGLGLDVKQILELAAKQGSTIEDSTMPPYLGQLDQKESPNLDCRKSTPCVAPALDGIILDHLAAFKTLKTLGLGLL